MNDLEFAIKMENEGNEYYSKQAKLNRDKPISVVFRILAKDETYHAEILKEHYNGKSVNLTANDLLEDTDNVFDSIPDFQVETKSEPSQLDVYSEALRREQESIDLYQKMLDQSSSDTEIQLFSFLIKEENKHFRLIDTLMEMLNRPNDWVESAEFGVREDY